jgi:16S rRNA (cytosine967-C5)-methyltransferase
MSKGHRNRVIEISREILEESENGHPIDSIMRRQFRERTGLSRLVAFQIREQIFQYLRWKGCVKSPSPGRKAMDEVREIERLFLSNPEDFPQELLEKVVPEWMKDEMRISRPWLIEIQRPPVLWIRCQNPQARHLGNIDRQPASESLQGHRELPHWLRPALENWRETLEYVGDSDLFRSEAFHHGELEIQDISSQIVSRLTNPKPGEKWWDACSGEGGKTMHLCQLMQNKGLIMATDRAEWRIQNLKKRAARAGVFNYQAERWNGLHDKNPTQAGKFDGILVDAPCTGVGTWQKNPDGRWRLTPEAIVDMRTTQVELLRQVWRSLKPGGRLVYAVCTMTQKETTDVTKMFQDQVAEAQPEPFPFVQDTQLTLWPHQVRGNGMFMAQWKKLSSQPSSK